MCFSGCSIFVLLISVSGHTAANDSTLRFDVLQTVTVISSQATGDGVGMTDNSRQTGYVLVSTLYNE